MKQVYQCEYCSFTGSASDVIKHEDSCIKSPKVKCCENCRYAFYDLIATQEGFHIVQEPKLVCKHRQYTQNMKTIDSICSISEPIPIERICNFYEHGKPTEVIPA